MENLRRALARSKKGIKTNALASINLNHFQLDQQNILFCLVPFSLSKKPTRSDTMRNGVVFCRSLQKIAK